MVSYAYACLKSMNAVCSRLDRPGLIVRAVVQEKFHQVKSGKARRRGPHLDFVRMSINCTQAKSHPSKTQFPHSECELST
eukprot:1160393-Pelagomonas_calceolata.AAC.9